ncbi:MULTISPECIES: hypothetical protein [Corynebacterium]|uniref:Uncharacterized protein n=2 Tax=Corynebacterium TaxID=1716 RepID=A0ABN4EJV9_9CORY|nr:MULTISPECIES: hypothetical protein [Corynebacterium]AEG83391.1 hypothetical protein CULC22_00678 [Corynebacterium ulcerans BR-AD22]AIU32264.1 Hypothetical protein CulFRC11_0675 [Corynebacterium ramonii FRC0011]AIU91307.1 Hypothetical protein Cul05146_0726 [Corynebacterium ulcerans]AKN76598.1 Hypothetical protein CulFRC58_0744 [Corynebacterium ulcerans FRC58]ESU58313.1 hypothetical protein D881_04435 [Corynebacterium ulcerans NCTC 12077]
MSSFLIKYQRRSGVLDIQAFDSFVEATKMRLKLDKENHDPDLEIVAVLGKSEEHIRKSHSRYFSAA